MPKHYRKKPVVIQAGLLKETNIQRVAEWCAGTPVFNGNGPAGLIIPTLEGDMRAEIGDYIIRGINGEFYPCKPDIFHKTYEKVED